MRDYLDKKFHVAVRVRKVSGGRGFRICQVQKAGNRHLVDIQAIETLPPSRKVDLVRVVSPAELIAGKVNAFHRRRHNPKSGTDWRDVAMLLLAFPDLKHEKSEVAARLKARGAGEDVLATWKDLVSQSVEPEKEDEDFDY